MKCKFKVISITTFAGVSESKVVFGVAMGNSEEDRQLWKQVSTGKIEMMTNSKFFEVGKEYYLDFTEATID